MSDVLIVAPPDDSHANVVEWSLRKAGHKVTYWDTGNVTSEIHLSVEQHFAAPTTISIGDSAKFRSGWVRRVPYPKVFAEHVNNSDKLFVSREFNRIIDNTLDVLCQEKIFWINRMQYGMAAEQKVSQLYACNKLGIRFPDTLVANDPKKIRAFCKNRGKIVVKPLDVYRWEESDGSALMSYANTITHNELKDISDAELNCCPAIYQQFIKKTLDLRVVYVAGEVFACSIENPHEYECIDYRRYQETGTLKRSPYAVPEQLRKEICALAEHFQVEYVSSDFCVDEDGNFFFLDLNPGGAFLFVEYFGGASCGIVAKIASVLGGGSPKDYLGFADFSAEVVRQVADANETCVPHEQS